ncbi:methylenetetrahydrofolate reductase C-terminal domain-containing protein [Microlunatus flavus]|uniref:5,10-methylenetetrahydrofolate reductase n=1 Tax=Microlunatus flavus TaxID=1036181 RepID=A0A1H9LTT8_9ACTN|nr:methylenetetrahydrofolate reductase C-terminal domain-containing protein [Microlunatus flavus]SER14834.1 5,10-methylenetetrahydrofolate reductase [Microlunatus flavus]
MHVVTEPPRPGCPKRMHHGPCGGVRADGLCEMAATPCVFLEPPDWPSAPEPATTRTAVRAPLVLTDLSAPPADAATLARVVEVLAPTCDAVLVGDHQDRPDFPPSTLARLVDAAGGVPWVTIACRDRNRVTLEQELRALALDGLATVLCVTGDGRAYDVRPDVTQVFDLDGTRLASLAAALGLPVAVPETPTAPPRRFRPARLVHKQRAGAGVAVLNHVPRTADVATFVGEARRLGLWMPVVASVPVFTDARSAAVLRALPGLEIDPDQVEEVLGADDPVAAGIDRAVREAEALLAVPGVAGVNLSGMASARGVLEAAEIQAETGRAVRARVTQARGASPETSR